MNKILKDVIDIVGVENIERAYITKVLNEHGDLVRVSEINIIPTNDPDYWPIAVLKDLKDLVDNFNYPITLYVDQYQDPDNSEYDDDFMDDYFVDNYSIELFSDNYTPAPGIYDIYVYDNIEIINNDIIEKLYISDLSLRLGGENQENNKNNAILNKTLEQLFDAGYSNAKEFLKEINQNGINDLTNEVYKITHDDKIKSEFSKLLRNDDKYVSFLDQVDIRLSINIRKGAILSFIFSGSEFHWNTVYSDIFSEYKIPTNYFLIEKGWDSLSYDKPVDICERELSNIDELSTPNIIKEYYNDVLDYRKIESYDNFYLNINISKGLLNRVVSKKYYTYFMSNSDIITRIPTDWIIDTDYFIEKTNALLKQADGFNSSLLDLKTK